MVLIVSPSQRKASCEHGLRFENLPAVFIIRTWPNFPEPKKGRFFVPSPSTIINLYQGVNRRHTMAQRLLGEDGSGWLPGSIPLAESAPHFFGERNMQNQTQKEPAKKNRPHPLRAAIQPYLRAPIIGAAFGILMVLSPIIMGGHIYLMLFSLGGLVIVVGGVITVAFMSFDAVEVHKALDAIRRLSFMALK